MIDDEAFPCYKCGVNSWTSCKHRKVERAQPVQGPVYDRREAYVKGSGGGRYSVRPTLGNGANLKRRKKLK